MRGAGGVGYLSPTGGRAHYGPTTVGPVGPGLAPTITHNPAEHPR
jgi:hypothetical protein